MLRKLTSLIYYPRSDDQIDEDLNKNKKDLLKWRPVYFNFIENKMRGKFVMCTNNSEYRLFTRAPSIIWRTLKAPPIGASWKYAKDLEYEYFSMSTLDGKMCKIKIRK